MKLILYKHLTVDLYRLFLYYKSEGGQGGLKNGLRLRHLLRGIMVGLAREGARFIFNHMVFGDGINRLCGSLSINFRQWGGEGEKIVCQSRQ